MNIEENTRASLVYSEEQMGSIGLYCAFTKDIAWSTETIFDKLENSRLDYSTNLAAWIYKDETPTWDHTSFVDKYTFMAYSPYQESSNGIVPRVEDGNLVIDYTVPEECTSQPDLMISLPLKDIYPQVGGVVSLNFNHMLASIAFSVKGGESEVITSIKIKNVVGSGSGSITDSGDVEWDLSPTRSELSYSAIIDPAVEPDTTTPQQLTLESGYLMMIPQECQGVEIEVTLYNSEERSYTTHDIALSSESSWEAGSIYNYIINTSSYDYTIEGTSSCYMLHPNGSTQIFYIPVEGRINTFWRDYADENQSYKDMLSSSDEWSAYTLWSECNGSMNGFSVERVTTGFTPNESVTPLCEPDFTTAGARSAMKITLPSRITEGNIVVAVEHSGRILWSWHLWITSYNPDIIAANNSATQGVYSYSTSDIEGEVHRYDDEDLWASLYDDRFIMDRNIGAYSSDYSSDRSGVLHYQFGRKDPFAASTSLSYDIENACVTFAEAVQNPTTFYTRPNKEYSWCQEGLSISSDYLWFDKNVLNSLDCSSKSIFDPSPLGWRVPQYGTYTMMTNSNCRYYNSLSCVVYNNLATLPMTGYRSNNSGDVNSYGSQGNLRLATQIDSSFAYNLVYSPNIDQNTNNTLADGFCVRAIEE